MSVPIIVPTLGESVVEATVGVWHKQEGDVVQAGDLLVELQTDKVDLEVNADAAGVLVKIVRGENEDVRVGDVLGELARIGEAGTPVAAPAAPPATETPPRATPVARRIAEAEGIDLSQIAGSGPSGKVTKKDVQVTPAGPGAPAPTPEVPPVVLQPTAPPATLPALPGLTSLGRREERLKMSRRRRTIAQRLVEAQHTAAMLTTFNEVDMQAVMALRARHKESFQQRHGVRLGIMSFFTKAVVAALHAFPRLNAEIDGDEMVLKHYYDIGIAVGAEEGLVVPVIRNADQLSFAEIEQQIRDFADKARQGTLALADLLGGTFTITNGGVFGSMLSTPILNPPQVGILGLHNIVDRPVVVKGEMVIRPIMYVALSYDHRLVDGREAVQFLYRIKELVEDPEQLLLAG